MKKLAIVMLLVGAGLCWFGSRQNQDPEPSQELDPAEKRQQDQRAAIEALEKLGATLSPAADHRGGYSLICRARITDADLVHLKSISNLRELRFTKESQITDAGLVQIAGLTELSYLSLHGTKVTDDGLRYLIRLAKLQILSLSNTGISDAGLLHLQGMSRLGRLDLSPQTIQKVFDRLFVKSNVTVDINNPELIDTLLEHLVDLKSLASGEGSNAPPADALLERLQSLASLARLDSSNPQVIDDLLEYLNSLAGLKELDLANTQVTDAGIAKLQKAMPNCKISH